MVRYLDLTMCMEQILTFRYQACLPGVLSVLAILRVRCFQSNKLSMSGQESPDPDGSKKMFLNLLCHIPRCSSRTGVVLA